MRETESLSEAEKSNLATPLATICNFRKVGLGKSPVPLLKWAQPPGGRNTERPLAINRLARRFNDRLYSYQKSVRHSAVLGSVQRREESASATDTSNTSIA
jgi:hypothetical protein